MALDGRRGWCRLGTALAAAALTVAPLGHVSPASAAPTVDRQLRVYFHNVENLVENLSDGSCRRYYTEDHLDSMLVDSSGQKVGRSAPPPDILIYNQMRGIGQAQAYADQLSAYLGAPIGTYQALVAWDDPEEWGRSHHCSDPELAQLKKKQTNVIIYNTLRLDRLAKGPYWSAGWYDDGAWSFPYDNGAGCRLYNASNPDSGTDYRYKWKRTSAFGAKFTVRATGTTVFAASMHLPEENGRFPCADNGSKGLASSGIRIGAQTEPLLESSTIRLVGVDANREIAPSTLSGYGMSSYGSADTFGTSKIDYLFVRGSVQSSSIGHTISARPSNHKALYTFVNF